MPNADSNRDEKTEFDQIEEKQRRGLSVLSDPRRNGTRFTDSIMASIGLEHARISLADEAPVGSHIGVAIQFLVEETPVHRDVLGGQRSR